jgi:hypothetical protein
MRPVIVQYRAVEPRLDVGENRAAGIRVEGPVRIQLEAAFRDLMGEERPRIGEDAGDRGAKQQCGRDRDQRDAADEPQNPHAI